ncbi:MAG: AAA family ATPase [Firmicutes bacterium]|nr:AAA family ATPase [Bacillota bacterium]
MNINDAKTQIKNAMTAYFTKDKYGNYVIPIHKQRPVFLMGPPGIGKTAIMEQIASEMGVGLLSYSMTHHTRQSALGLPFIEHKVYQGQEFDISEYTMSEIIASVYELMENTGVKEGILFLDEINCVSETLTPIMLQFLQYKVFGRHQVPEGWIVVTAGNPPEYNNSVREFDIVTWDRLKRVDCEPDFEVWKEYAYKTGVHPSVLTYLEVRPSDFYKIESTVDGKTFVTARGWDDLSQMIILYEQNGIDVDEMLVRQYVQNPKIAKSFAVYYDLFNKYRSDYQVDAILAGNPPAEVMQRAKEAKFDERLSLVGLITDAANREMKEVVNRDAMIKNLMQSIKTFKIESASGTPTDVLASIITAKETELKNGKKASTLSSDAAAILIDEIDELTAKMHLIAGQEDATEAFKIVKQAFDETVKRAKLSAKAVKQKLSNMFIFCEEAFGEGQELFLIVNELTASYYGTMFISRYGCEEYFKHNKSLIVYDKEKEIDKIFEDKKDYDIDL